MLYIDVHVNRNLWSLQILQLAVDYSFSLELCTTEYSHVHLHEHVHVFWDHVTCPMTSSWIPQARYGHLVVSPCIFGPAAVFMDALRKDPGFDIKQHFQGAPIVGPPFPYYCHTTPTRIPWSMGSLWEGGPTIGGPWRNLPKPALGVVVGIQ